MTPATLIEEYLTGPEQVRQAVAGMTKEHFDAAPIPGQWTTRQVVCHLADFEPIYADRMKRVIAETDPTFFGGDPDVFASRLAYEQRNVAEELELIDVVRRQMARILRTLTPEDFQRTGRHTADGPLSIETLLTRITGHIPHHVAFIKQKRTSLGI